MAVRDAAIRESWSMSTDDIDVDALSHHVDMAVESTGFSGVIRVDRAGETVFDRACGFADRRWSIPMSTAMQLSIASGTKGFTALAAMALVETGELTLGTRARALLGEDLPLIDDEVTIEHLLGHRSGIGDYLDEETMGPISIPAMAVPVHQLDSTESYLAVLDGFPQVSPPGAKFAYNNGAFAVLAVLIERAAGQPFRTVVDELVVQRAGLPDTGFIRSDALPPGVATGYLERDGLRNNCLHLPVIGTGDGGMFTTAADVSGLWTALFAGRIVNEEHVALMTYPHSDAPADRRRYGLGFWLASAGPIVILVGYDAGVSFRTMHDPTTATTRTVIANTSEGTWELGRLVPELQEP